MPVAPAVTKATRREGVRVARRMVWFDSDEIGFCVYGLGEDRSAKKGYVSF